ncbi:hypothetical protein OG2516_09924 [Oceanicola granulosus HTCC2516]|uniref:YjbH domain-containing protein n=1 Tax=Oceanicola granulosus (strain ATCC BAA-861 / DSM 15982 / KCTC 12143 / HTCC2516) TaxID=314256 RepID=Q2CDJ9_OCEGH|nr:YjbH domain-containing protein [Oceanicola granulosus]EAR50712.1 hypothetical protein OG2516_09924 [Oceanicola granulosus HTCC2516]
MGIRLAALLALAVGAVEAAPLGTYATPGLLEMPTAGARPDGTLAFGLARVGPSTRAALSYQLTPRLRGAARYAIIDGFDYDGLGTRYDRSFDLHLDLLAEGPRRPAVALGLRDFGGTGIYSSEYLVATKQIGPLAVTAGLGWGRLAGRVPLGALPGPFAERPAPDTDTGQLDAGQWFRGPAAPFAGLSYQIAGRTTLLAEYSPDLYRQERARGAAHDIAAPVNLGLRHRFDNGLTLGAAYLYGRDIGLTLGYRLDPARPRHPGGREGLPEPLAPRDTVAARSWNRPGASPNALRETLDARLLAEGIVLEGLTRDGPRAGVRVVNEVWSAVPQAAGRTARVMANVLPPEVTQFDITFVRYGLPITTVSISRAALEAGEHALEGDRILRAATTLADARPTRAGELPVAYPAGHVALAPYVETSLFDPDSPLRYSVGAAATASLRPMPGLVLAADLRYPLHDTIGTATRRSDSVLPHVRTDAVRYAAAPGLQLHRLTATHLFRPGRDLFGRVTAGYLERMYGGVSAELLWHPLEGPLALGLEINAVRQRDFNEMFGFRGYDSLTGHASAYYDLPGPLHAQLDVGRYLAGDWGGTLTVMREYDNGVRIGAFATLTDVSFDEFGEGAFDKGLIFEVPLDWFTRRPTGRVHRQVLRPVQRDGGARLAVAHRLYPLTRDYRGGEIDDRFARITR